MEQSPIHGANQQERESYDLGYLAGMIDGEGSIMVIRQAENRRRYVKVNGETSSYISMIAVPAISISNTNSKIIDRLHQILEVRRIGHYVQPEHPDFRNRGWKPSMKILIRGWKRCRHFIEVIGDFPFLAKAEQLECMRRLIYSRFSGNRSGTMSQYSPIEIELMDKIKSLNYKGLNPQRLNVLAPSGA